MSTNAIKEMRAVSEQRAREEELSAKQVENRKKKIAAIDLLIERLQPNTFVETATIWLELRKELMRIPLRTIRTLNLVVLCQRSGR